MNTNVLTEKPTKPKVQTTITDLLAEKWPVWAGATAITGAAIAIVVFTGVLGKKEPTKELRTPVLTVSTQPATMAPIERALAVHGSISAWDPISVGATASGMEIKAIRVDEGDIVKKGQVLAVLDSSQLQAQLDSEKARLKASIASVSKSIQPNRPEDINGLTAAVAQAEATVEDQQAALIQAQANQLNAEQNLKRYEYLKKEGAVSTQELETRQTNATVYAAGCRSAEKKLKAAEFVLKQAQERLSMAKIGGRQEDIQIAHANVAEIQGNIRRLQTQIDQTIIKAPVDGLITQRDAHIGDISSSGKPMFYMSRDNRLELKAQVPETDLRFVKPGQQIAIESTVNGVGRIEGHVREISPLVDQVSRLATVRIDLPNNRGLKAGMFAEGHVFLGKYEAVTVPAQAVVSKDEKNTVFVLHKDKVESRQVVLGNRDGNLIEIKSGLNLNEPVVINGGGFLKDGDYVALSSADAVQKN
jgi:HlyD family secretion protein